MLLYQAKKFNKTPLIIGGSAGGIVVLLLFVAVAGFIVRKLKYNDGWVAVGIASEIRIRIDLNFFLYDCHG